MFWVGTLGGKGEGTEQLKTGQRDRRRKDKRSTARLMMDGGRRQGEGTTRYEVQDITTSPEAGEKWSMRWQQIWQLEVKEIQ